METLLGGMRFRKKDKGEGPPDRRGFLETSFSSFSGIHKRAFYLACFSLPFYRFFRGVDALKRLLDWLCAYRV